MLLNLTCFYFLYISLHYYLLTIEFIFYSRSYFSDRMAENIKAQLDVEEFGIKEEIVYIKEEILPSSTVEDTCTINLLRDDIKMEYTGIQGKLEKFS